VADPFAGFLAGLGVYMFLGKFAASKEGKSLGKNDACKYKELWEAQLAGPGFEAALEGLYAAWTSANTDNAITGAKKFQVRAESLAGLFKDADDVGRLWVPILEQLARDHGAKNNYEFTDSRTGQTTPGCVFKPIATKKIGRALQKVHRSYFVDKKTGKMLKQPWRKLCDLCRASLVFRPEEFSNNSAAAIDAMTRCIHAIGQHPDLQVVNVKDDDKMRLRTSYKSSDGYRDIQFCVRLESQAAKDHGVHGHFAELQLHFGPIVDVKNGIKREGGRLVKGASGHANYVKSRNLRGS